MKTWQKKGQTEAVAILAVLMMALPVAAQAGSGPAGNPGLTSGADAPATGARTAVAGMSSALAIVFPHDGGELRTNGHQRYKVMGTGAPGARVTVTQSGGQGGPVTVIVDPSGNWTTGAIFNAPPPINDAQHCTRNHSSCKSYPGKVTASQHDGGKRVTRQRITIYGVVTFN